MKKIIIIYCFAIVIFSNLYGQMGVRTNSSNFHDPRLMFVNPAGMTAFRSALGVIGYKLYYVGIDHDNLNNGFLGFSYPIEKFGAFGITGQYFRSHILNKQILEANYATPVLFNKITFGLNFGLLGISYDNDNFNLIDENDPLLTGSTSKNSFNFGFGMLINPIADLFVGVSLNHLNQPDISLEGGKEKLPITTNVSLIYNHWLIQPLISFENIDKQNYVNFGLEKWFLNQNAMLRGLISPEQFSIGAAYLHKNFRFDYEYEYALSELNKVTTGFHQFTLSYYYETRKPDFALAVIPFQPKEADKTGVYPSQEVIFHIEVKPIDDFQGMVTLKADGIPQGVSASLSPQKIRPGGKSLLKLQIEKDCSPGMFPFVVAGQSGAITHSAFDSIKINSLPAIHADIQSLTDTLIISEIQQIQEESPLLPYIFFKDSSHTLLANRYQILKAEASSIENFSYEKLTNYLDQYRNILNIIAKRLRENPDNKIKLIGCNCDCVGEQGDTLLSRKRALAVKDYLVKNCGILESQIEVEARNRPENASSNNDSLGREENRRVEIVADSGSTDILDPLIFSTTEIQTSDSLCLFSTKNSMAAAGIQSWQLSIQNTDGQTLRSLTGKDSIQALISWDWKDRDGKRVSYSEAYQYRFRITDKMGQVAESNWKPIYTRYQYLERELKPTKKIEKIRLILFKFNRDDIDVKTERLQQSFRRIVKKLEDYPSAELIVKGHTDIIGTPEYNMVLSIRRAETIYQELVRYGISETKIKYEGYGDEQPLMSNDLPEGRMMNRRVEIEILYAEL